jgi:PAS domain S-box-containing protein
LIIVTIPDENLFHAILASRPQHIRILSCHVFRMLWQAICVQEEKLREQNEEFQKVLNGIQDFILVMSPDMIIIDANQSFLDHTGYSREDVIGRRCHEIFQKANQRCNGTAVNCPLYEAVRTKRATQRVMTRIDNRLEPCYFEVTIFPIFEADGRIQKFIEISRDITQRKRQEEEITRRLEQMVEERTQQLRETHAKLIHQDKMASLGKLSASVVHEVNNPIAGILNLILLMKRIVAEEPDAADGREAFGGYLNLMEAETRRIGRIVSNLLSFSRQAKMEFKPANLNTIIEKTLQLNANLIKIYGIRVQMRLDPELPEIVGSADQLQQVVMNIVSNAVEAMEGQTGGLLAVESRRSPEDGKIQMSFTDTGVGIPKDHLPQLFEPFFTTKKKGSGVGLGLAVAYGIVQEHGGAITVDSTVDKGTTFVVDLPLNRDRPSA